MVPPEDLSSPQPRAAGTAPGMEYRQGQQEIQGEEIGDGSEATD